MEKKTEQQNAEEILGRLRESYLSEEDPEEVATADRDDKEFREKLAGMLQKAESNTTAKPADDQTLTEAEIDSLPEKIEEEKEEIKTEETAEETSEKAEEPTEEPEISAVREKAEEPEKEPVEKKPVEEKPVEEKPIEEKPVEEKPIEEKPVEKKPIEEKPVEEKPVEEKPVEKKPIKEKPIKEKPVEEKPVEEKPVEEKPVEKKPKKKVTVSSPISAQIAKAKVEETVKEKEETEAAEKSPKEEREAVEEPLEIKEEQPEIKEEQLEIKEEQPTAEEIESPISEERSVSEPPIAEFSAEEPLPTPPQRRHIFRRRTPPKKKVSDVFTQIRKKYGFTQIDIDVIFELGYENEFGRVVGYDLLKQVKAERIRMEDRQNVVSRATSFGSREREVPQKLDKNAILATYAKDKFVWLRRTLLTFALLLLAGLSDLPFLFGTPIVATAQRIPWVFHFFGAVSLFLAAWLSYRQIWSGIRAFFRFTPTPYSVPAIITPFALLYGVVRIFADPAFDTFPMNFFTVFLLFFICICDGLRLFGEEKLFRMVFGEGTKLVLEPAEHRKKKLRKGDTVVKIINDDVNEQLYRVRRAKEVSGFFRRCSYTDSAAKPFSAFLILLLSSAIFVGFFAVIAKDEVMSVLSSIMLAGAFACPLSAILLYTYPLYSANRSLLKFRCALIGEESVEEYRQKKELIFEGNDLLRISRCTRIYTKTGENSRAEISMAEALLKKVGSIPALSEQDEKQISLVRIADNGVEALSGDSHKLLAGNVIFLKRNGIRVPPEEPGKALHRSDNVSLMYVAIDGELRFAYEVEYVINYQVQKTIRRLKRSGTSVAIRSFDPNINDAFAQSVGLKDVKIFKPGRYETQEAAEIADSGVVVMGGKTDFPRSLNAACRIYQIRQIGYRLQGFATIAGSVFAGTLAVGHITLSTVQILLSLFGFQATWLFFGWFLVQSILRPARVKKTLPEKRTNEK